MNTTQPRVRITPARGGGWLIRCGACPATDIHDGRPIGRRAGLRNSEGRTDDHHHQRAGRSLDTPEVLP